MSVAMQSVHTALGASREREGCGAKRMAKAERVASASKPEAVAEGELVPTLSKAERRKRASRTCKTGRRKLEGTQAASHTTGHGESRNPESSDEGKMPMDVRWRVQPRGADSSRACNQTE